MRNGLGLGTAALVLALGCSLADIEGDGIEGTEAVDPTGVRRIDAASVADVEVIAGPGAESATLTCDQNLLEFLEMEVDGDRLSVRKVGTDLGLAPTLPCRATISVNILEELEISGSGDIECRGGPLVSFTGATIGGSGDILVAQSVVSNRTELEIAGAGNISLMDVDVAELDVEVAGAGDVTVLDGLAETANLRSNGSGSIDTSLADANDVEVTIGGSGDVAVTARDSIIVTIGGSGNADVFGNPPSQIEVITGSGEVRYRTDDP